MKKLLIFAALLAFVLVITACGGEAVDTTSLPQTDAPEVHIHNFVAETTPATCTEEGRVISKCECGEVESDEILPPNGHTASAADCENDTLCEVCGELVAKKTGHVLYAAKVVTQATCTEDGLKRATCSKCGKAFDTVISASHEFMTLTRVGDTAVSKCSKCQATLEGIKITNLHDEASSKLPYENGKVSFLGGGSGTTYGYFLPAAVIGADKEPYQIEFTLTFDHGTNTSGAMGGTVYNKGNGKHLLKFENASYSILRQYAVEDGNGGYLTDTVDIGSMVGFDVDPIPLVRIKKGESARFTFVITPAQDKVDIFVNGEYKTTRKSNDKVFSAGAANMVFGDSSMRTAKIMSYTVSDISMIRAEGFALGKPETTGDSDMINILFIGNSQTHYNSMPTAIFAKIAESAGYAVKVDVITKDGRSLHGHLNMTDEPAKKVAAALAASNSGAYDYVVIQEQTLRPIVKPSEFYEMTRKFASKIRAIGAEPILYIRTGWQEGNPEIAENGQTYESMHWTIAATHEAIAKELDIKTAGAIYGFYDICKNNPEINVYNADMGHPSYAGSYIAALTVYAQIFGEDPVNVKFDGQLDGATAEILRKAASKAVNDPPEIPDAYKTSSNGDGKGAEDLSNAGIDNILGLHKVETATVEVSEDTYVSAGGNAGLNFGGEKELLVKALEEEPTNFYRIALLKFDISSVADVDISSAMLELYCSSMQDVADPTTIHIYGCDPTVWSGDKVTYNTMPQKEDLVATVTVSSTGKLSIDILDYVKLCRKYGDKEIGLYIEGDTALSRVLKFSSKESGDNCPKIIFGTGDAPFSTILEYVGENPWDVAIESYSEWVHRWAEIQARGDDSITAVERDASEFSLKVSAATAENTNGYDTKYKEYDTRLVSTLKGYTASTEETAKLDAYGGLMDESMKQEATGFFYSKKIGDRWWTIDPLGYPFFRTAINTVITGGGAKLAKYGTTADWAEATTNRLRELGFNSAGCWSDTDHLLKAEEPLSQTTRHIQVLASYTATAGLNVSQAGSTELLHNVMPVFDPAFEIFADSKVKTAVAGYATNSYIYGWISDNELPHAASMLDSFLRLDPTDSRFAYSYATAWTFMYMKTGKADVSIADVTDALRVEFRAMVYDKYFSVVCAALDRYAPYQQYMGCRFLPGCYGNEQVMRVAGYWCDVISFNYYGAWTASNTLLANQAKWAGKPVIITEWYAKGMDVWEKDKRMTNTSGAGWTVKDQDARGMFYQNFALSLMEAGGCVGFDWFLYWDNDPTNTAADLSNRNSNKGIMDNDGNEYTVLTGYMSELNNQKYNIIEFFDGR